MTIIGLCRAQSFCILPIIFWLSPLLIVGMLPYVGWHCSIYVNSSRKIRHQPGIVAGNRENYCKSTKLRRKISTSRDWGDFFQATCKNQVRVGIQMDSGRLTDLQAEEVLLIDGSPYLHRRRI